MKVFSVEFFNEGWRDMTMCEDIHIANKQACIIIAQYMLHNHGAIITARINRLINDSKFTEAISEFKNLNDDIFVTVHEHNVKDCVDLPEQDVVSLSLVR